MPNSVAWLGWIIGLVSLGISMWQLIQDRIRQASRDAHARHLLATIDQLRTIRALFTEALDKGEAFKADADKAVIRAVAHNLLAAENHINAALGPGNPR